jgi:asparagine synthase (glutamine-hydrolysing)
MCGIAGVLNFDGSPVDPRALKRMTDAIAHRGPDGEGWYRDKGVGLGHRRLAIIDLSSAGRQPMVTVDGRFALTFNGEVYNFRELRSELEDMGHTFRSQTDSEVVLRAWAQWGDSCIQKFNGMFSFSVWDSQLEEMHLVRDRYGIKPLYYTYFNNWFAFASEQRAILTLLRETPPIDEQALTEYLTFQNILSDRTLNSNIRILPAGNLCRISARSKNVVITQYWDYDFNEPSDKIDPKEYEAELLRLLRSAVSRQVSADVDVGAFLSGGIDSGLLTALGSELIDPLKTFTCGFDESAGSGIELSFDERAKAEKISSRFGTEQYEVVLKSGDLERSLETVALSLEEPRVGQSYPNYYVSHLASRFVKVALSGIGGDELFGGYPWRYFRSSKSMEKSHFLDTYFRKWSRLLEDDIRAHLIRPMRGKLSDAELRDTFNGVFGNRQPSDSRYESFVNASLHFEAKTFLHGLLVVEDKLSMVHGLETRVPFLDNDVVDFAMKCPVDLKVRRHLEDVRIDENSKLDKKESFYSQNKDGKLLLRRAASRVLPDDVTQAGKQGFSAPDADWFRGPSIVWMRSRLLDHRSPLYELLDYEVARLLIEEHISGRSNRRLLIWSLLSLDTVLKSR